jgi:putative salt-induced outer membrane protein YdiY
MYLQAFINHRKEQMKSVIALLGAVLLLPISLHAQEEEWKANAGFSGVFNSGNSVSQTLGGNGLVSVKRGMNQVSWSANGAYGRAKDPATGTTTTNTENWMSQLRYDRFLSETFSLYGLGRVNRDAPAGFDFNYGGSAGLAHFLYKSDMTTFKYELGFDAVRQRFIDRFEQNVYSVRGFLQYTHKFSDTTFLGQDVEGLYNVQESEDWRLNTLTSLNLKMTEKVAFQLGYVIRVDNQPVPTFKKVDTQTQVGLNINFL